MHFSYLPFAIAALTVVEAGQILPARKGDNNVIAGSYIVVMKDDVTAADFDSHRNWAAQTYQANVAKTGGAQAAAGKRKSHVYHFQRWKGYSGAYDDATIQEIAKRSEVEYVEHDQIVRTTEVITQNDVPSWGLGRVSSKSAGILDYVYDSSAGEGITVYGVDTGIDIENPDFEGRASWGTNLADQDDTDTNGHGTHTASTMVGKLYGVAKKAKIVAVKVLDSDGNGAISDIVAGMEWAVNHAKENNILGKAVMNMSLGSSLNQALNDAATSTVAAGVFLAVAAGNDNVDAYDTSPASAADACTVAASTSDDAKASFSNFGAVVDVYAPGEAITAAFIHNVTVTMSGTSMASPHVAGVGAYLMALEGIEPAAVCDRIKELAVSAISSPGDNTTDQLLFNGISAS